MRLTVLGSGTSTGVPIVGCTCPVCLSPLAQDKRLRASVLLQHDNYNILIDSSPDLRTQLLRNDIRHLDAVFYTHIHYDHSAGMDDLRPLSQKREQPLVCYGDEFTVCTLQTKNPHVLNWQKIPNLPRLLLTALPMQNNFFLPVQINNFSLQPIRMRHVRHPPLDSIGYVVNKKLAYLTDVKSIEEEYQKFLFDLEVMIIGSPLSRPHSNHVSIPEACAMIKNFRAKRGYITHLAHEISHHDLEMRYGEENISFAFDGLCIDF